MKSYFEKHHKLFGAVGGVTALVIAAIYLKVIPEEASIVGGLQNIILLYGHSLCWVLLSIASYLWGMKKHRKLTAFFAYSALITYVIFIGILMITKSA